MSFDLQKYLHIFGWGAHSEEICKKWVWEDNFKPTLKYETDKYTVTTADGYENQLFRVRLAKEVRDNLINPPKWENRVVLLMHGVIDSADGWFVNPDKENSIARELLEQGYDLWVGNNRGNKYSQGHSDPTISKTNYWNFSWDEMGLYDTPANYKFILNHYKTDEKEEYRQINYIGHSEGTSQMFVAGLDESTAEFMTKHTRSYVALAPVVYMDHVKSKI
jgi:pimeloyl-ACP methyl ester carboxylesterase